MSYQEPGQKPTSGPSHSKKARKSRAKRLRRTGLLLVLVLILLGGSTYLYALFRFNQIHKVAVSSLSQTVPSQPFNILLVGDNTRQGLNPAQAKYFGSATQVGGGRSDVTMIAHFNPANSTVSLVSIPRDLFVPIPNTHIANRVDDALNLSPEQLVKTIEYDLGIPIQRYVELNFDSFQNVVNALGGVKMYFPMPIEDAYSGLNVQTPGCKVLNGFQALELVRARHLYYYDNGVWTEDPLGDLSRIRRDHEFLKVLAEQVRSQGLLNPVELNSVLGGITKYLTVDSGFTLNDMISIAEQFRNVSLSNTPTVTLPIALENNFVYNNANYGDVVFPAQPQDQQIIDKYLGLKVPNIPTSQITVSVMNGSGTYDQATQVSQSLAALGYKIGTVGNATVRSSPAETIIRYTPGHIAQAEVLLNSLSGAVVMGRVQSNPTGTPIELVTGTGLVVASPPSSTQSTTATTASPSTTAMTSATNSAQSSTSITAPITLPATQYNQPLQPWDPRACPS
jgi:LCP family protein required for cell wall assembly